MTEAAPACARPAAAPRIEGPPPETLRERRDFLACAKARRHATPAFVLQARARRESETPGPDGPPRVGYTCSKKVGNAVARNRAKRRLREAARGVIPTLGRRGWDYVLIGRAGSTAAHEFAALLGDLETALARVHAPRKDRKA